MRMQITSASYVVLALQIVTLLMLGYGAYLMKYKRRMQPHALLLTAAMVINLITVALFMVPRFFNYIPFASMSYLPDLVLVIHHTVSLIALALILIVTLSWLLRGRTGKACLGVGRHGRKIMRTTYLFWLISIVLGILVVILSIA